MATTTFTCNKDARVADSGGTSLGAGASDFNPIGTYSGYQYRTLLGFSYSFTGMVSISSAILHYKTSTQYYVAFGSDPDIAARRLTASWSEGSAVSLSGSNAVEWDNQPSVTGTTHTADVSPSENTWDTMDITNTMQEALAAGVFYGLRLYAWNGASESSSSTDVTEIYARENGSSDAYITVTYTTNVVPSAPTSLSPSGGGIVAGGTSPTISFTHVDSDGDALLDYDIQVTTDATFAVPTHLNATPAGSGISGNNVSVAYDTLRVAHSGTVLTRGTTYYWRARTRSSAGESSVGPWSAGQSFKVNQLPTVTLVTPSAGDALVEMTKTAGSGVEPRMVIRWTFGDSDGGSQYSYRVVTVTDALGAFNDSGTVVSTASSYTVPVDPTRGSFYRVTVTVTDANGESTSTAQVRMKVQWAVAEYRVDLGGTVTSWSTSILSTAGTNKLVVTEYASSAAGSAISTWYSTLASAALARWFHWRVYLFAWSGATTPSMDKLALTYTSTAGVPPDGWTFNTGSQFTLDTGSKVYGTQSLKHTNNATGLVAFQTVRVERNTDYILSGRIKSDGNSVAKIQIVNAAHTVVLAESTAIAATQDWTRTQTPVWNSGENDTCIIRTSTSGAAATYAWFDALKMEASRVVTPWTPGFVGTGVVIDVGGLQIDASPAGGAVMRLQGVTGGTRDTVELGNNGLLFGGDTQVYSPSAGVLAVSGGSVQINKSGTTSAIIFPAQTNDPGYIKHIEVSNSAEMRFSASDDRGATDFFTFGSDPAGAWSEGLLIATNGALYWSGTAVERDVTLYRASANVLKTDDSFDVGGSYLRVPGVMRVGATAFPGSPTTNDTFYRTDLGLEFYWDGSRWLTTQLFQQALPNENVTGKELPITATTADLNRAPLWSNLAGASDVWLVDHVCSFYVGAGTALGASHKWVGTCNSVNTSGTSTTRATINIAAGSSSAYRIDRNVMGALAGANMVTLQTTWTKTGTPGSLYAWEYVTYRLVAT